MSRPCWPYQGCFGPTFPPQVIAGGKVFLNRNDDTYDNANFDRRKIRGFYVSASAPRQMILIYRDCTFEVMPLDRLLLL